MPRYICKLSFTKNMHSEEILDKLRLLTHLQDQLTQLVTCLNDLTAFPVMLIILSIITYILFGLFAAFRCWACRIGYWLYGVYSQTNFRVLMDYQDEAFSLVKMNIIWMYSYISTTIYMIHASETVMANVRGFNLFLLFFHQFFIFFCFQSRKAGIIVHRVIWSTDNAAISKKVIFKFLTLLIYF